MKKWMNMMCTRIVLIQKVTAVVVKNSISHKPSLIAYQQSGDMQQHWYAVKEATENTLS
jgi:hypothetical protein